MKLSRWDRLLLKTLWRRAYPWVIFTTLALSLGMFALALHEDAEIARCAEEHANLEDAEDYCRFMIESYTVRSWLARRM